jgi:hypothetical protein
MAVQDLRGWIDYDRPFLPALTAAERIDYFEKRVRLVAINPLRRILKTEVIVAGEDSSALLIFGVSICCAIEATGKFLKGERAGNGVRFHAFLNRYMAPDYAAKTVAGLTYGFAVRHGGFEGNPGQDYFSVRDIAGTPALEINPSRLFDDFVSGFENYLVDLRAAGSADPLFIQFDQVFTAVFIKGD